MLDSPKNEQFSISANTDGIQEITVRCQKMAKKVKHLKFWLASSANATYFLTVNGYYSYLKDAEKALQNGDTVNAIKLLDHAEIMLDSRLSFAKKVFFIVILIIIILIGSGILIAAA